MSTASDMVNLYITAEKKVLKGQSYTIDGTTFTRANLSELRNGRIEWERKLREEQASSQGGSGLYSVADWTE